MMSRQEDSVRVVAKVGGGCVREVGMGGVVAGQGGVADGGAVVGLAEVYAEHLDRVVGWFVRRTGDRVLSEA